MWFYSPEVLEKLAYTELTPATNLSASAISCHSGLAFDL